MPKARDLAIAWINRLKNHPAIAAMIVISFVVGGLAKFTDTIQWLIDFGSWLTEHPYVAALSLSPGAIGFGESEERLFAVGKKLYRTFQPRYPWNETPIGTFLVTVTNPTKRDTIITKIIYDVKDVGEVAGGPPGPLNALATYHHRIEHKTGPQPRELIPPFRIPSESVASFELEIASSTPGIGFGWLLRLGFESDAGTFYSEEFQLYLPPVQHNDDLSENTGNQKPAAAPIVPQAAEMEQGDLFSRRLAKLEIPDRAFRECLFRKANIALDPNKYDNFDRDMLYMRAANDTLGEFLDRKTETAPAIPYRDLLSVDQAKTLMTFVKSRVACH